MAAPATASSSWVDRGHMIELIANVLLVIALLIVIVREG